MTDPETYNRIVTIGVDIQNDFCPGGALGVADGDAIIDPFNRVAAWTRQHRGVVALTRDWHPSETTHFNDWGAHCVAGTEGAELHKDLTLQPDDIILDKGTQKDDNAYSGFQAAAADGTTLEQLIIPKNQERVAVLIGGLATDWCVKATVLDARAIASQSEFAPTHRLDVYVIADAMKAVGLQSNDERLAVDTMKAHGAYMVTSQQILDGQLTVKEQ